MTIVGSVLLAALYIFLLFLIGRLVLEILQSFARQWRPTGVVLVIAEAVYTVTDPPLRLLRKVLRPVRIGTMMLDIAFLGLWLAVIILMRVNTMVFLR